MGTPTPEEKEKVCDESKTPVVTGDLLNVLHTIHNLMTGSEGAITDETVLHVFDMVWGLINHVVDSGQVFLQDFLLQREIVFPITHLLKLRGKPDRIYISENEVSIWLIGMLHPVRAEWIKDPWPHVYVRYVYGDYGHVYYSDPSTSIKEIVTQTPSAIFAEYNARRLRNGELLISPVFFKTKILPRLAGALIAAKLGMPRPPPPAPVPVKSWFSWGTGGYRRRRTHRRARRSRKTRRRDSKR